MGKETPAYASNYGFTVREVEWIEIVKSHNVHVQAEERRCHMPNKSHQTSNHNPNSHSNADPGYQQHFFHRIFLPSTAPLCSTASSIMTPGGKPNQLLLSLPTLKLPLALAASKCPFLSPSKPGVMPPAVVPAGLSVAFRCCSTNFLVTTRKTSSTPSPVSALIS